MSLSNPPIQPPSPLRRLAWLPRQFQLTPVVAACDRRPHFTPGRSYNFQAHWLDLTWTETQPTIHGPDTFQKRGTEAAFSTHDDTGAEVLFHEKRLTAKPEFGVPVSWSAGLRTGASEGTFSLHQLARTFSIPQVPSLIDTHPEQIAHYQIGLDVIEHQWQKADPDFSGFKPFQREDLSAAAVIGGAILAWEPGLGKTIGALAWGYLKSEMDASLAQLILMPAGLKHQWLQTLVRFQINPAPLRHPGGIHLLSYSELIRMHRAGGTLPEFHSVVLDEAVRLKEQGTQAAAAVRSLRARHWLALTGTPQKNRLEDLFPLCHLVATMPEERAPWPFPPLFHETAAFERRFLVQQRLAGSMESWRGSCQPQNLLELWRLTAPLIIRRRKVDCPGIVQKHEHTIHVPMDGDQHARYLFAQSQPDNLNALRLAAIT